MLPNGTTKLPSYTVAKSFLGLIIFLAMMVWHVGVFAGPPDFTLPVDKGTVIGLPSTTDTISVAPGSDDVVETNLLDAKHLYVRGKKVGTTNIILCNKSCCFRTLKLEVGHDLESLKYKLHEVFPEENPKVYSSRGAIVVAGQVSSIEKMNAIMAIAGTFAHPGDPYGVPQAQGGGGSGGGGSGGGGSGGGGSGGSGPGPLLVPQN
jgi:pilus assembly protein CpaC